MASSLFKGYSKSELDSALRNHRKLLQFWKDSPNAIGSRDSQIHHQHMIDTLLADGAG
jgi:hypothetical protein